MSAQEKPMEAAQVPVYVAPEPPDGLGPAGLNVWELTATYEFSAGELHVLALAAHQADDVALLESTIGEQGATVTGAAGQDRLNAALTEVRQSRLALAKLLGALCLPAEDAADGRPMSEASRRASKAANARWAAERARRG